MKTKYLILLCSIFFGLSFVASGQTAIHLDIQLKDQSDSFWATTNIQPQTEHADSVGVQLYLQQLQQDLYQNAYLAASIDQLVFQDSTASIQLFIGLKYDDFTLANGNIPSEVLSRIGRNVFFEKRKNTDWIAVQLLQEELLVYAENNGYPFASTWLENVAVDSTNISAILNWELGKKVVFGQIKIIGAASVNTTYLSNYLDIRAGETYSKTKLLAISKQLKNVPFVTENKSAKVTFLDDKATVYLFLEDKNASRFDLLIGLLPDNRPQLSGRRSTLSGNGVIDLFSTFGRGERLTLEFQQVRPQTQELNSHFSYPYLFKLPVGVRVDFDLFKNDTTSLLIEAELGIQYLFSGTHQISFFVKNNSTRLLAIDTDQIIQTRTLPVNLDTRQVEFGMEHQISQLDNRFNPRRGWLSRVRASVGEKSVARNNTIIGLEDAQNPTFDFGDLYNNIEAPSTQYKLQGQFQYFIPLARRSAIHLQSQNGIILNEQAIYENELFRIGGNQTQRGFDEESLLGNLFSVNTIEYRWLFAPKSNIYAFTDIGYIEKKQADTTSIQQPIGLGLGVQLETGVGIFGISIAIGKDQRNRDDFFDLRSPKIHFGYVNVF